MTRVVIQMLRLLLKHRACRFYAGLEDPGACQAAVLERIAERCAASAYGRRHGVINARSFLTQMPVVGYDDLEPWVEQQKATEQAVLTPDPVLFYEKTSGSSGPAKYIPYTAALRRSFTSMFQVWAHDMIARGPRLTTGKMYFSISPSFSEESQTSTGVPVGLEDDSEYLEGWLRRLISPWFISPPGLGKVRDPDEFKRRLCSALLLEPKLEIVSVWNPSFLKVHLDWIAEHAEELLVTVGPRMRPRRAAALAAATSGQAIDWTVIWPDLKLVSCWASANATRPSNKLAELMPHAMTQGKGLLATEAPMTVPLIAAGGYVPMVDEVYFELEDDTGRLRSLDAAEDGAEYGLVISQLGGLYRYRIGDRVRIDGRFMGTPRLELVGRSEATSDLVGEKLHEAFVADVVGGLGVNEAFVATLVPCRAPEDHYVLVLDRAGCAVDDVAKRLEGSLMEAYHYRHARMLGQLGPARVKVLPEAADAVLAYHVRRGMRAGDVKHRALLTTPADRSLEEVIA